MDERRAQIQSIAPGPAADLARRMTPDLLQSNGATRRVGPFHMTPATAQAMILQRLEVGGMYLPGDNITSILDLHCASMMEQPY